MKKHFEFTDETIEVCGVTLHRIRATKDLPMHGVKKGDLGGFVEKLVNVQGDARVCGDAEVYGDARVCGDAKLKSDLDFIVFKNWWSSGRYFTWTRSNNKWAVGCFYGTGKELIAKAYADSEKSGREYERVVKYVESVLADEKEEKNKCCE